MGRDRKLGSYCFIGSLISCAAPDSISFNSRNTPYLVSFPTLPLDSLQSRGFTKNLLSVGEEVTDRLFTSTFGFFCINWRSASTFSFRILRPLTSEELRPQITRPSSAIRPRSERARTPVKLSHTLQLPTDGRTEAKPSGTGPVCWIFIIKHFPDADA